MKWLSLLFSFFALFSLSIGTAQAATIMSQTGIGTSTFRASGTAITYKFGSAAQPFNLGSMDVFISMPGAASMLADAYVNGVFSHGTGTSTSHSGDQIFHFVFNTGTTTLTTGDILEIEMYPPSAFGNYFYGSDTPSIFGSAIIEYGAHGSTTSPPIYPYVSLYDTGEATDLFTQPDFSNRGVLKYCGISDISACVTNALAWAFVPDDTIFDQFGTLKDDIKNKPPFGYFTSAVNAVSSIRGTDTPQFTLEQSSPLMTYIFTPIRTGLAWVMYLAGLFWLYKRVTNIVI